MLLINLNYLKLISYTNVFLFSFFFLLAIDMCRLSYLHAFIYMKNKHVKGRIQKILNGQLLPMKALGYFAVVTGMPDGDDQQIDKIKQYEADFFENSR